MVVICLCSELQWAGGLGLDLSTCFLLGGPTDGGMFFRVCSRGLLPAEHGSCLRGLATQFEGYEDELMSCQKGEVLLFQSSAEAARRSVRPDYYPHSSSSPPTGYVTQGFTQLHRDARAAYEAVHADDLPR